MGCVPILVPVHQYEADANPVYTMVIIQEALAIPNKVLNIAADPLEKGKTPFSLQGAVIGMETEIVSEHNSQPVFS